MEGDYTTVRRLFAFSGHFECNGDVTATTSQGVSSRQKHGHRAHLGGIVTGHTSPFDVLYGLFLKSSSDEKHSLPQLASKVQQNGASFWHLQ